jgi:hypothetical protein
LSVLVFNESWLPDAAFEAGLLETGLTEAGGLDFKDTSSDIAGDITDAPAGAVEPLAEVELATLELLLFIKVA